MNVQKYTLGRIHGHTGAKKGKDNFIAEVSVDETDAPQNPVEMFLILAIIGREGIPAQTNRLLKKHGVVLHVKTAGTTALKRYEKIIAVNVTGNLFDRHIKPLFS